MRTTRSILYTSAAVFSLVASGTAFAAPEGGVVSRGSATITQAGKKTDIRQKSNKVILDWRSFDIGADEHTQFYQPSKNAIALNRINDVKASQIDGKLTANGNIMLINPNGVVFGKGAQVNVGSLTATTADIDDDDFMAGKMDFKQAGNTAGKIVNNGSITVKDAGLVNFVAPQVENNGTIVAKLGKVQLAAADTFTLDMAGDGILQVAVSPEDGQKIAKNSGDITAQGGYVAVTAAKARGLIDSLVDNSGVIEASSMTAKGGKIILSAEGGTTKTSGTIKANGKKGGGEILIGGDYQGVGTTPNSKNTEVSSGAVIEASATSVGNGGKVIVWADGNTNYAGSIKAQGGVNGGNGGFVETSGKGNLHVAEGSGVTASARNDEGEAGVWLLDPSNVTITDGSGDTIPGSGGTVNPPHDSYTINASSISAALNGGNNVIIATTSGSGEAGDITVTNATISKTVTNNSVGLSLRAARNITIENSSITSSANGIGLTINADRDANSTGAVKISNSNINLNGGSLVIGGGTTVASTPVYASQDGVFDAGVTIDNSTIQTLGAGNITIRGTGENTGNNNYGIWIKNNSLLRTSTTGSTGTITLIGTGGAGGNNNHGVYITGGSTVRSDRGATITGTGGSNGTIGSLHNVGVMIDGGAKVEGRGTGPAMGSITITGVGGAGYGQNHGVQIADDTSRILNTDGDLIIHGTSGYNAALGASPGTNYGFGMSSNSSIESIGTTAGEAGNITITSIGEDTVLGGGAITSVAGNIGINTDSLNMALGALGSTSGNITIAPYEDSASIGLGGGAGKLNLTDAELATINTGGKLVIGKSGAGTGDIDLDSWDWSSKNFSGIEIYGNDIDIGGMTMGAGNFLAHAMDNGVDTGSLNVSAAITRSVNGVATLDLRADQDITVNAHITANDANSDADGNAATSADSLNVILNADRDNDDNGSIATTGSNITTLGGYFVAGGGSGTIGGANGILGDGDGTGADDDYAYILGSGNALSLTTTNITTSGGHAVLNGFAFGAGTSDGIVIDRSKVWTGNGDLIIKGRSTGNTGNPKGLTLSGDVNTRTAELVTTGGDIKISATTTSAQAIYLWDDSQISTTDGDIEITAYTSGTTPSLGAGGATATNHITSTNGNITLALDDANLSGISAITAGNTLTIKGYDPSMSIGLGGGAGSLNLNDNELAKLFANKLVIGDALLGTGDIYIDTWDLSGKTFDVEIYGNAISIGGMTMGVGNFLAHAMDNGVDDGDIGISANITRSVNGVATLDLRADHNIKNSNDADIIAYDANSDGDNNPDTSADSLNVILNADRDGDHNGAIALANATITTLGGYFVAGGGSGVVGGLDGILGNGDGTGADDVATWGNAYAGIGLTGTNINAGAGGIYLKGQGSPSSTQANNGNSAAGIRLVNSSLKTTGLGGIKLHGTGGGTTASDYNIGVYFREATSLESENGDISVYGKAGSIGVGSHGVAFSSLGTNTVTTKDGNIDIEGQADVGSDIHLASPSGGIISNGSGDITLRAVSNAINRGFAGTFTVGGALATGDISLIANALSLQAMSISTSGDIYVRPYTSSTSIGLGGGAGDLNLTDAELAFFNGTGKLIIGDSASGTGDIDLDSWNWSSKLFTGIEIYGNDIDIGGLTMGAGNFMAHAMDNGVDYGDLNISANITRGVNNAATLDLRADRNITNSNSASITASDANSDGDGNPVTSADSLNVILNADRDGDHDGAIFLTNAAVTTMGGNFIAGGGSGTVGGTNGILGDGDGTGADDAAAWGDATYVRGVSFSNSNVSTGDGAIILNGHGFNSSAGSFLTGVNVAYGTRLTTTSGLIQLNGEGGQGDHNNYGVNISDNGTLVTSSTGAIRINGTGGTNGLPGSASNTGVVLYSGGTVSSTGTGADASTISINAIGSSNGNGGGIVINNASLLTKNGDIDVYGETGDSYSIRLYDSGVIDADGSGDITLTGKVTGAGRAFVTTTGSNKIGGSTTTGEITLIGNSADLAYLDIRTSGDIYVKPYTSSTSIGLGGGAGDLNLSDAELAFFNGTGKLIIGDAVAGTGDLDLDSWDLSTKLFSVDLYGNDIDIGGLTMGAGNFMAYARDNGVDYGDLNISANITRAVDGIATLELYAHRNITNSNGADIIASDANSDGDGNPATSADSLNVILNADRGGDHDGAISLTNATITTLGGNFIAGGGSGDIGGLDGVLGNGDGTGADDAMAWGSAGYINGIILNNADISTSAGNLILNGHGSDLSGADGQIGIYIYNGSTLETTSGDLALTGTGGAGNRYNYGIGLASGTTVTSSNGKISIDATAGSNGSGGSTNNDGLVIEGNSVVSSTGTGAGAATISITATGAIANGLGSGLYLNSGRILTKDGDVNIEGNTLYYAGIALANNAAVEADGAANITLIGTDGPGSSGALHSASGNNVIGGANSTGDITLIGNTMEFSSLDVRTAGTTYVKGYSASTSIGLGGGAGDLNLSDAELGVFNGTGRLIIGDAAAGTGDIDLDSWNWSSKLFSGIEIYGNDIDIGGMTMGAGNFMAHAMDNGVDYGDLNFSANITRAVNGDATLDLRADRDITNSANADIIATDANSDGDANPATSPDRLNVILNADRDGDHSGAILLTGAAITTLGGNFIAGGGSGDVGGLDGILGNGDGTGADDAMAWGNGSQATGITLRSTSNVNTGTGSVYLNGHGNDDNTMSGQYGINLQNGGNIATTSGAIKINGYGGVSTQNSYGINMNASTITTETGFIDIYVHSGAAPTNNSDFAFFNNSILESTGSGSIRITGGSNSISNFNIGTPGANRVGSATMTGDIEIIGDTIQINDTDNSILSQGNIYIKPLTDSQSIGLGGGNGGLNLTDSELSNFNGTGKLIIGNSGTGTGDIDLNSWDLSSKLFDVELYGNDIDIGGLIMGAGDFMAYAKDDGVNYGDLVLSAGISRAATGDATLDLRADRNLSFNSDASITSANGRLNVLADADYNNAAGGAIIYNASSIATNGGDITFMDGFSLNGDTNWNAGGGTFTTGGNLSLGAHDLTVVADNVALGGNIAGNANSVLVLKSYDDNRSIGLGGGAGGFNLTDAELSGLNVGHLVIGDAATGNGDIAIQSWSLSGKSYDIELYGRDMDINGMTMGAGDVTMIAGGDVTVNGAIGNSGAGGDLYIDVGNDFTNTAGASAIALGTGGRFLIYIDDLSHITRGGMTTGNLFGRNYTNDDPSSINTSFGNRFVFDETPTITVTANDVTLGAYDPSYNSFTYSVTGLATGDTAGSALGGNPSYGTSQLTPTTYSITPSTGTLTSTLGYLIAFHNGTLTMPVDPGGTPPPTTTPPTQPPPAVSLPPSVEHQIQLPQLLFSEGYQVVTSQNASFMSNNEGMLIQRKLDGFRVNTNEADAFVRMIMGGYLQIEQPVVDYYGLSSYESEEF